MQKWELSNYQWEQIKDFFSLKLQNAEEQNVTQDNYSMQ